MKPQNHSPITANLVTGDNRLDFLPTMFGPRLMLRGEMLVYEWMDRLSEDYGGGLWNFYTLSNGGFYMAPLLDKPLSLAVSDNWFEGELSADAAGIVATLFALCQLSEETQGTEAGDTLIDRFYFLRGYAADHAEARLIFAAID